VAENELPKVGLLVMEGVVGDELLEGANESVDEGGLSPTHRRFGTLTPSLKSSPVPRPVTPTRGTKRVAVVTLAPAGGLDPTRRRTLVDEVAAGDDRGTRSFFFCLFTLA
jgi:hypothetical protein